MTILVPISNQIPDSWQTLLILQQVCAQLIYHCLRLSHASKMRHMEVCAADLMSKFFVCYAFYFYCHDLSIDIHTNYTLSIL